MGHAGSALLSDHLNGTELINVPGYTFIFPAATMSTKRKVDHPVVSRSLQQDTWSAVAGKKFL